MDAERAFDFLEGEWDATCRIPTGAGWDEALGSLKATWMLDRKVSLELFEGLYHGGRLQGLGLRAFDRASGEWVHTWADNMDPADFHVWRGRFGDGKIRPVRGVDGRTWQAGAVAANVVRDHQRLRALGERPVARWRQDVAGALGDRTSASVAEPQGRRRDRVAARNTLTAGRWGAILVTRWLPITGGSTARSELWPIRLAARFSGVWPGATPRSASWPGRFGCPGRPSPSICACSNALAWSGGRARDESAVVRSTPAPCGTPPCGSSSIASSGRASSTRWRASSRGAARDRHRSLAPRLAHHPR